MQFGCPRVGYIPIEYHLDRFVAVFLLLLDTVKGDLYNIIGFDKCDYHKQYLMDQKGSEDRK
mgnify:CR=1 FL=1